MMLLAATVPLGEDDLLAAAREAVSRRLLVARPPTAMRSRMR